jgi:hypothetical protein
VFAKYEAKRAEYQEGHEEVARTRVLINTLKAGLQLRTHNWKIFRQIISIRAKSSFTDLMSKRGFGKLLFLLQQ